MQPVRLLLVDSDILTADVLADALCDAGYEVVRVADGEEGSEFLGDGGGEFRALVTEVDFGGRPPNGWGLARSAREMRPQIAVVYASERGAEEWPVEGVPNSVFIPKPYAVGQIVTAVSSLLAQNNLPPNMREAN